MAAKEPVLLVVLIESAAFRWWVGGISLTGEPIPLLRSEAGNLKSYVGLPFDEQVSFLRHRLCGVLQRGCDRLWGLVKKPCQIVMVANALFADAPAELTTRVAEHFVLWMTSPGVAFFVATSPFGQELMPLQPVAGEMQSEYREALYAGLSQLVQQTDNSERWATVPTKIASAESPSS